MAADPIRHIDDRRERRVQPNASHILVLRGRNGGPRIVGHVVDMSYRGVRVKLSPDARPGLHVGDQVILMFDFSEGNQQEGLEGVVSMGVVAWYVASRDKQVISIEIDDVRDTDAVDSLGSYISRLVETGGRS
jgi:hypothetical protein